MEFVQHAFFYMVLLCAASEKTKRHFQRICVTPPEVIGEEKMEASESPIKRNILITLVMITISVILCTLGFSTANQPIDSIAVVWPRAILQAVGTILFGGWGIVATIFAGMITNAINVGTAHAILGYSIPNFLQSFIPAFYYRRILRKSDGEIKMLSFKSYLIFAAIVPNLLGALFGTFILHSTREADLWFSISRWLIANIPITLVLGWPLLFFLGPTMAEERLLIKGWWK
ncbi:MAG: hypothetical protein HY877_04545 [Deltaproteobacteria bacterium]|nr:hypothetical protein [Deltaproteobacteria bacterium]